jgi:WD40 repeat protein
MCEVAGWSTTAGKKLNSGARAMSYSKPVFRAVLQGHSHYVTTRTFSPDGRRLATVSWDEPAQLWDVKSGQRKATLPVKRTALARTWWSDSFSANLSLTKRIGIRLPVRRLSRLPVKARRFG